MRDWSYPSTLRSSSRFVSLNIHIHIYTLSTEIHETYVSESGFPGTDNTGTGASSVWSVIQYQWHNCDTLQWPVLEPVYTTITDNSWNLEIFLSPDIDPGNRTQDSVVTCSRTTRCVMVQKFTNLNLGSDIWILSPYIRDWVLYTWILVTCIWMVVQNLKISLVEGWVGVGGSLSTSWRFRHRGGEFFSCPPFEKGYPLSQVWDSFHFHTFLKSTYWGRHPGVCPCWVE